MVGIISHHLMRQMAHSTSQMERNTKMNERLRQMLSFNFTMLHNGHLPSAHTLYGAITTAEILGHITEKQHEMLHKIISKQLALATLSQQLTDEMDNGENTIEFYEELEDIIGVTDADRRKFYKEVSEYNDVTGGWYDLDIDDDTLYKIR
jgi:hypothetical protein